MDFSGPRSRTTPRSLPPQVQRNPRDSTVGRRRGRGGGLTFLRVRGLRQSKAAANQDGGLGDLLSFLERKASSFTTGGQARQVMIKKSHAVGDYVFIGATKEDAEELIKLNTFTFASAQLEIVESDEDLGHQSKVTESKETQELRAKLQTILSQRYLSANKLLKLDALATDAQLVDLGMFENRERALKTFKGLMVICDGLFRTMAEKNKAIESISLASNSIDDVSQVESVATTFPQLKNLDMSGNQIGNLQALERWKGKFKDLETLYMTGNPIEATEPNYQATLLEWFPKLQNINGTHVRTAEQIEQQAAASRPKPIPQSGPDFRDVNGIGENFLLEFFTSFDQDRQALASRLYDESSQFSIAVDARSVRDSDAPAPLPWSSYIKVSRNLIKITHQNARMQRLFRGANIIQDIWKGLPLTKHPNIKEDLSKYIMDCHPLPGLADPNGQIRVGVDGLIVSVHGEFEEYDQKTGDGGKRSFSRTFVLGPGQPGNGPIRVVSDMLSLRAYNPLPNVFAPPAEGAATANDPRQAMITELSKLTGMVPEYCEMCLSQVEWQFDKAIAIFHEKKAELPAEAFSSVPQ
ncbi:leucine rich repeats (2 copies) domain-containing protein [Hirsutella rhossiliensis]|uniref:Leucine rich repeats (2 copies) domain-containing protein n=1 Tax=Hirsutella rhossiliensis TaxID=111463 RepID=A0A9P8SFM9_9HYPO|nr:leucine rich repeats (2 copies) domain-containing protein [Hirsutella rhossiliensis]KAH0960916.1 leucine rich repeats (2 copies) domain-containing protein [Hirsutella rhossiliensis]